MKKYILGFLLVLLVGFLFISSNQTYEQQSLIPTLQQLLPHKPLETLLSYVKVPYGGSVVSLETKEYYHFIEFLLRKGAHFSIFGLVGLALYVLFYPRRFSYLVAIALTFLLAIGDEYHQSITGGRTPTFWDVALDVSGAVFFVMLAFIYVQVKKRCRN